MTVTGVELNLAPETFKLQHLLDSNLLAKGEEIEEICSSAVKEEAVEKKLTAITARWSSAVFTFADYKTRGPVLLQVKSNRQKKNRIQMPACFVQPLRSALIFFNMLPWCKSCYCNATSKDSLELIFVRSRAQPLCRTRNWCNLESC